MEIKLFVGTRYTTPFPLPEGLIKIPHQGKEFVGLYLKSPKPTLKELRHAASVVRESLQKELPSIRCDHLPMTIFPQLFCG